MKEKATSVPNSLKMLIFVATNWQNDQSTSCWQDN